MVPFIAWFMLPSCTSKQDFGSGTFLTYGTHCFFIFLCKYPFKAKTNIIDMSSVKYFLNPPETRKEKSTSKVHIFSITCCDKANLIIDSKLKKIFREKLLRKYGVNYIWSSIGTNRANALRHRERSKILL